MKRAQLITGINKGFLSPFEATFVVCDSVSTQISVHGTIMNMNRKHRRQNVKKEVLREKKKTTNRIPL